MGKKRNRIRWLRSALSILIAFTMMIPNSLPVFAQELEPPVEITEEEIEAPIEVSSEDADVTEETTEDTSEDVTEDTSEENIEEVSEETESTEEVSEDVSDDVSEETTEETTEETSEETEIQTLNDPEDDIVYEGAELEFLNDLPNSQIVEIFGMNKSEIAAYLTMIWSHPDITPAYTSSIGGASTYARMMWNQILRAMQSDISDSGTLTLTHGDYFSGAFGYNTTYFYVNVSGSTTDAYCIDPTAATPPTGNYDYYIHEGGGAGTATYAAGSILYQYEYKNDDFKSMWNASMDEAGVPDSDRNQFNLDNSESAYFMVHSLVSNCWHAGAIWDGDTAGAYSITGHQEFKNAFSIFYTKLLLAGHPSGYEVYFVQTGDGYQNVIYANYKPMGKIKVNKQAGNMSIQNAHPEYYDLDGAVYGVYSSAADANTDTNRKATLTISDGTATTGDLTVGTYYVKEITAPKGYRLDPEVYQTTVISDQTSTVTSTETNIIPPITMQKASSEESVTASNSNYSKAGAVYQVYTDAACTTLARAYIIDPTTMRATSTTDAVLTTVDDGSSNILYMARDLYYVKETSPSLGFKLDPIVYTVDLRNYTSDTPYVIRSIEPIENSPIKMKKVSSEESVTASNSNYSKAGAVYQVYTDAACTVEAYALNYDSSGNYLGTTGAEMITDDNGDSNILYMARGLYYVKETSPSPGFGLDTTVHSVDLRTYNSTTPYEIQSIEPLKPGEAAVKKVSSNTTVTLNNNMYSLAGAVYYVYKDAACTTRATDIEGNTVVLTTDADGNTNKVKLPYGRYYIKEVVASKGYAIDRNIYPVVLTETNKSATITSIETPHGDPAAVEIYKYDADTGEALLSPDGTTIIGGASLEGAVFKYTYYDDYYDSVDDLAGKTPKATWYLKTIYDSISGKYKAQMKTENVASGYTSSAFYVMDGSIVVPLGTLTIEEQAASDGYLKVPDGGSMKDKTGTLTNGISIMQIRMNAEGTTAETYVKAAGDTSYETNASGDNVLVFSQAQTGSAIEASEQPKRGNFSFRKRDYETLANMPYCFFKVTASSGESHIVVTGADGTYNSASAAHSANTNGYDDLYDEIFAEYYNADGSLKSGVNIDLAVRNVRDRVNDLGETGLWFFGSESLWDTTTIDDTKGACRYDEGYIIEELPCPVATKYETQLMIPAELSVTQDGDTVALGTFTNMPEPTIKTREWDADTETHYTVGSEHTTIIDTFTYNYLQAHTTYTMKGILMEIDENHNILGPLLDADGNMIRANKVFTTDDAELVVSELSARGTEDTTFTFNGTNMNGKRFVIFEYLYKGTDNDLITCSPDGTVTPGRAIASHADATDDRQIGYTFGLGTRAFMKDTEETITNVTDHMEIVDICTYQNVFVGQETVITGTLHYRTDDGAIHDIVDETGAPVVASTTFVPTEENGEIEIHFPAFDGTQILDDNGDLITGGITCYEVMTLDRTIQVRRENIDDVDETIRVLEFHTNATDSETLDHLSCADEDVTIYDEVSYQGLLIGKEYTVKGILMNTDTGEPLLDKEGNEIVAEETFTATASKGSIRLTYTFDGSLLEGATGTVFEDLYEENLHVGTHADLSDEKQTVHFPKIGTKLLDEDGEQIIVIEEKTEITPTDTVSYENLIVGKEYTITGTLMNVKTKEVVTVDGEPVTKTITFVPTTANGTTTVTFDTFDVRKTNLVSVNNLYDDLVCFEELFLNDVLIEDHKDYTDTNQTFTFESKPTEIGTLLLDEDGEQIVLTAKKTLITATDTVKYENIVDGGRVYRMQAVMMNARTQEPVLINGEPLVAEATFTPDAPDGEARVTFPEFDVRNSNLKNDDNTYSPMVCFETLFLVTPTGEKKVTEHKDFTDTNQTIVYLSFARVKLLKTGPFLTGTRDFELKLPDGTTKTVKRLEFEKKPFAGITFTVYDKATDEAVTSFTSDADGVAISDLIPYGKGEEYYVKETDTPGGLVQSQEVYELIFSEYDDDNSYFYNKTIEIDNDVTGAELNVYKEGEFIVPNTTDGYGIARKGIADVYFGIFANEDLTDNAGSILVEKDTLVGILKTDETGKASSVENLVAGKYYYQELCTATKEYELDTKKYEFAITYKRNTKEEVVSFELNYSSPLLNNYKKQDVELLKVDQNDNPIAGVKFDLYRKYKDEYIQIGRYTTREDGTIKLSNVPYGDYYFIEVQGVPGYEFDGETKYHFSINDETIGEEKEPIKIKAVNRKTDIQTGDMSNPTRTLLLMILALLGFSTMLGHGIYLAYRKVADERAREELLAYIAVNGVTVITAIVGLVAFKQYILPILLLCIGVFVIDIVWYQKSQQALCRKEATKTGNVSGHAPGTYLKI